MGFIACLTASPPPPLGSPGPALTLRSWLVLNEHTHLRDDHPEVIRRRGQIYYWPLDKRERNDYQRRLGLNFVFATRALITSHRDSSSFSKLPKNWATSGKDIKESWKATERALRQVTGFLRQDLGWTTRRWLPSANAIIPLVYLLRDRPNGFLMNEKKDVCRYLFITAIRGLFRGSVETTINSYVSAVRRAGNRAQRKASLVAKRIPKDRQRRIKAEDILHERGMYSS